MHNNEFFWRHFWKQTAQSLVPMVERPSWRIPWILLCANAPSLNRFFALFFAMDNPFRKLFCNFRQFFSVKFEKLLELASFIAKTWTESKVHTSCLQKLLSWISRIFCNFWIDPIFFARQRWDRCVTSTNWRWNIVLCFSCFESACRFFVLDSVWLFQ